VALEQGRDVMAVPGNVLTGRNTGSHSLLKDGAKVVESADDILDELGWAPVPTAELTCKTLQKDSLLASMQRGESYGLDELAQATGLGAAELLVRLTRLELLGEIASLGAGRFALPPAG
jgi:DNA processing protein